MSLTTLRYINQLNGSPEGALDAPRAELVGDRLTGNVYRKTTAEGVKTGWERLDQVTSVRATGTSHDRDISDRFADVYSIKDFSEDAGGGSSSDREVISSADTAAGSSKALYFPPGTYRIASNLTINAKALQFSQGAMLSIDAGVTVTINGTIQAGLWQIFSGSGSVSLGGKFKDIPVSWWGPAADGTTDDTTVFAKAVAAVPLRTRIYVPEGTSIIDSITVNRDVGLVLHPLAALKHRMSPAPTGPMLKFTASNSAATLVSGGTLDGNKRGSYAANSAVHANGILVQVTHPSTSDRLLFEKVTFQNQISCSIEIVGTPVLTVVRDCVFKDGWEYADDADAVNNPDARNSEYISFGPQGSSATPHISVENCYFGSSTAPASTTHFPVGVVLAGNDTVGTFATGTIEKCVFENLPGVNMYAHCKGYRILKNTFKNPTRYAVRSQTSFGGVVSQNYSEGIRSDAALGIFMFDATTHGGVGDEGGQIEFSSNYIIGSSHTGVPAIVFRNGGNSIHASKNFIKSVGKGIYITGGSANYTATIRENEIISTVTPSDSTGAINIDTSSADFFIEKNVIRSTSTHGIYAVSGLTNAKLFLGDENYITVASGLRCVVAAGLSRLELGGRFNNTGASLVSSIAGSTIAKLVFGRISIVSGSFSVTWANVTSAEGDLFYTGTPESVVAAPVGTRFRRTDGGTGTTLYVKESGTGNTGWVGK
jgi:hypothetical protein